MKFDKAAGSGKNPALILTLVSFLFVMSVGIGIASAAHTSTADLEPEWSATGQNINYEVNITNDGPDTVDEVRIYKNENYEDFLCDENSGWELYFIQTLQACFYVRDPDTIGPGQSEEFTFSATTPDDPQEVCGLARPECDSPGQERVRRSQGCGQGVRP